MRARDVHVAVLRKRPHACADERRLARIGSSNDGGPSGAKLQSGFDLLDAYGNGCLDAYSSINRTDRRRAWIDSVGLGRQPSAAFSTAKDSKSPPDISRPVYVARDGVVDEYRYLSTAVNHLFRYRRPSLATYAGTLSPADAHAWPARLLSFRVRDAAEAVRPSRPNRSTPDGIRSG